MTNKNRLDYSLNFLEEFLVIFKWSNVVKSMFIGHIHVQADFVCVVNSDGTMVSQDYKSSSTSDYRWEGYIDPDTTYLKAYSIKGGTYKYIVEPNYTATPLTVTVAAGQMIAQCNGEAQALIIWEV